MHLQADLHDDRRLGQRKMVPSGRSAIQTREHCTPTFYDLDQLPEVNWTAVEATDFRTPRSRKENKPSFWFSSSFPWSPVERIGVFDREILNGSSTKSWRGPTTGRLSMLTPVGIIEGRTTDDPFQQAISSRRTPRLWSTR